MSLNASLLKQILSSLKSDNGRPNEQRHKPRVGVRGKIQIRPLLVDDRGASELAVWVRDVSADGIGILLTRSLKPETRFVAYFLRPEAAPLQVTYVVAHSTQVSRGLYVVGARVSAGEPRVQRISANA